MLFGLLSGSRPPASQLRENAGCDFTKGALRLKLTKRANKLTNKQKPVNHHY